MREGECNANIRFAFGYSVKDPNRNALVTKYAIPDVMPMHRGELISYKTKE